MTTFAYKNFTFTISSKVLKWILVQTANKLRENQMEKLAILKAKRVQAA